MRNGVLSRAAPAELEAATSKRARSKPKQETKATPEPSPAAREAIAPGSLQPSLKVLGKVSQCVEFAFELADSFS